MSSDEKVRQECFQQLKSSPQFNEQLTGLSGLYRADPQNTQIGWSLFEHYRAHSSLGNALEHIADWLCNVGLNYQADARRFLVESKNLKTLMPKVIAGVRAIVESSLVGSLSMEVLELTRERVDPEDELTLLTILLSRLEERHWETRCVVVGRLAELYELQGRRSRAIDVLMETAHSQRELDRLGRQILSLSTEKQTALQTLRHFERTFDAVALNPVLAEFAWTVLNKTDLPMSERVERAIAYTNAGARLGREFWVDAAAEPQLTVCYLLS